MIQVEANPSTAYHPQTDGQTERINAKLEKYLRAFINAGQTDWTEWLPIAEFAINNRVSRATGASPFQLNYGRDPRTIVNIQRSTKNEAVADFLSRMERARQDATAAIKLMNTAMKEDTDKHHRPSKDYAVGAEVWLDSTNLNVAGAPKTMKKLLDKRVGPFKILEKVGASAYKLDLPEQWTIHPTFNESKLTPFVPPFAEHQKRPPPAPADMIDGHEEYEVEEILNSRKRGRYGIEYFVHWKGYGIEERTWEPPANITHADDSITEFHKKYPDRPKPYVKKAARVRFVNTTERPAFLRSTFPKDFFDPYVPGVYGPATVNLIEPLTTGIDYSVPDLATSLRKIRERERERYIRLVGPMTPAQQCLRPSCPRMPLA